MLAASSAALIVGRELWLDESHSVFVSRLPLTQLWAAVAGDVHPPLYFIVLRGWISAIGDSPFALRILSLVCMGIAAAAVWRTARREDGEGAGLLALALIALSPAILVFAVEIRMYALVMLTFSVALLMIRRVRATPNIRDAVLAGVAGALSIYTHYTALFAVAGLFGAWLVLDLRAARARTPAIIACTVCALLVAPWIPTLMAQRARKAEQTRLVRIARTDSTALAFGAGAPQARQTTASHARVAAEDVASVLGVYPARSASQLGLLALPFAVMGLLVLRRTLLGDRWMLMLIASAAATIAGVWLLGITGRRYILLLGPLCALAIAHAIAGLDGSRWRVLARGTAGSVLCLLAAGTVRMLLMPKPTPVTDLIGVLKTNASPADRLLFNAPYGQVLFDYYARRAGLNLAGTGFPESTTAWWSRQPFRGWGSAVPMAADIDREVTAQRAATQGGGELWLVLFETNYYDPYGLLRSRFEREGTVTFQWETSDTMWRAVRIKLNTATLASVQHQVLAVAK
jgi:4-amino-4-deoxy-L-arabinose transferase-like glycosyltransferase